MSGLIQRLFASLFFGSVTPVLRNGRHRYLVEEDMPALPEALSPSGVDLGRHPLDLRSPWRFAVALVMGYRRRYLLAVGLVTIQSMLLLTTPLLVHRLITMVRDAMASDIPLAMAILTAAGLALVPLLFQVTVQHYFYVGLAIYRSILNVVYRHLYEQAFRVTQTERAKTPVGDLVNHMSNDADTVADTAMVACEIYNSTIVIVGGTALLFWFAGWSAFVAVAAVLLVSPVMRFVAPRMVRAGDEVMSHSDTRVSSIAQTLRGIRIVKYFCWGRGIEREIGAIRERELGARFRFVIAEALANLGFSSIPVLMALALFGARVVMGQGLDAATAFSCISAFAIMRDPIGSVAHHLGSLLQIRVSAARLIRFFSTPALVLSRNDGEGTAHPVSVTVCDLVVQHEGVSEPTIKGISLEVRAGESVAIVGPVASGKSTLLLTLLGETPVASGTVSISNPAARFAWVPQEAFILNATVKDNILLGAKEEGLERAVFDAMLVDDLRELPAGLATEIGDHGVNLSGGQKQRVSLARAAMQEAALVLLDDPLSAVDHQTEEGLVNRLLFGRWLSITRIVATHRLTHLARFDRVIFLVKGIIVAEGSYRELMERSAEFRAFVAERAHIEEGQRTHDEVREPTTPIDESPSTQISFAQADVGGAARVTEEEERATGAVGVGVYSGYLRYYGGESPRARLLIVTVFLLGLLATTALPMLQESWLALWLNRAEYARHSILGIEIPFIAANSPIGISIFALLGLAVILSTLEHLLFSRWRALRAGRRLHERAFGAVLRAPIRFFDSTPMGRILNRFSRDMLVADQQLASSLPDFVWCITKVVVTMLFIIAVVPHAVVVMVPVFYLYYRMQATYRASAREAKRLTSISASPLFSHFKETLEGLAVVRAFGRHQFIIEQFQMRLARNQQMFHAMVLMNRWFSARIPLLSGAITLTVTVSLVLLARAGEILPATAGLALGFVLNSTGALNWAVRAFSDLESQMTSIQRLLHFTKIAPEPDVVKGVSALAEDVAWPTHGTIEFVDVKARYASHLPLVLKGVTARVPGGRRVALVGRTGSGKSTIFQALFRFVEITEGEIRIDGVNIASIPLERLRSAIAVIPQDPVLFIGTLRRNLDYFNRFDDDAIWDALRRVRLAEYVKGLPGGLAAAVLENGSNLSQGQRQLVCLARAFLDRSRIIVMDEATASVDVQTDALIQQTIREECAGLTVLVIAHRLGTVSDCDLTLHLEDGRVVPAGVKKGSILIDP
jgi:ABC-type multidrug transport system fused ATPase/permease subunit